jgi:hypothetical protein
MPVAAALDVIVAVSRVFGGRSEPSAQNSEKLSDQPVPSFTFVVVRRMNRPVSRTGSLPVKTPPAFVRVATVVHRSPSFDTATVKFAGECAGPRLVSRRDLAARLVEHHRVLLRGAAGDGVWPEGFAKFVDARKMSRNASLFTDISSV